MWTYWHFIPTEFLFFFFFPPLKSRHLQIEDVLPPGMNISPGFRIPSALFTSLNLPWYHLKQLLFQFSLCKLEIVAPYIKKEINVLIFSRYVAGTWTNVLKETKSKSAIPHLIQALKMWKSSVMNNEKQEEVVGNCLEYVWTCI